MKYRDRLRIWESDYGRSDGWDVEIGGAHVAFLDEPRWEEMFWVSYRLTPTTADPALRARILSESFWTNEWPTLAFRSRATGWVVNKAFPSLQPFVEPGRLMMRGLYVAIGRPLPWDWVVLRARSLWRRWGG